MFKVHRVVESVLHPFISLNNIPPHRPITFYLVKVKVTQSNPTLCDPKDYTVHWNSPDQNTGVGSHSWLQVIFSTQGSNPGILHCSHILCQLSHQGSPWILEWVAYPFSSGSSQPRNQTRVSCIAGGFFTSWATFYLCIHQLMDIWVVSSTFWLWWIMNTAVNIV